MCHIFFGLLMVVLFSPLAMIAVIGIQFTGQEIAEVSYSVRAGKIGVVVRCI